MDIVVYPIRCKQNRNKLLKELTMLERNTNIRWGDSITKPTWMDGILDCDCVDALILADGYLYWSSNARLVCNKQNYKVEMNIEEVIHIQDFIYFVNQRI